MDELKIKSTMMRGIVGKAVTKYLKKKGVDLDIQINDIDGASYEDGTVQVRADIIVTASTAQVIKIMG